MRQDLFNNVTVMPLFHPKAAVTDNTAQVSEIIDRQNARGVLFAINHGTNADADATYTVLVEDGDNSSLTDNAAVADEYLLGTEAGAAFTFANDNAAIKIGYAGPKRYVRVTITPANNTGNVFLAGTAILHGLRGAPDTDQIQP